MPQRKFLTFDDTSLYGHFMPKEITYAKAVAQLAEAGFKMTVRTFIRRLDSGDCQYFQWPGMTNRKVTDAHVDEFIASLRECQKEGLDV